MTDGLWRPWARTVRLCRVGVGPTKVLREKVLCSPDSSTHILYNQAIVGCLSMNAAPTMWIGNVPLTGGISPYRSCESCSSKETALRGRGGHHGLPEHPVAAHGVAQDPLSMAAAAGCREGRAPRRSGGARRRRWSSRLERCTTCSRSSRSRSSCTRGTSSASGATSAPATPPTTPRMSPCPL